MWDVFVRVGAETGGGEAEASDCAGGEPVEGEDDAELDLRRFAVVDDDGMGTERCKRGIGSLAAVSLL